MSTAPAISRYANTSRSQYRNASESIFRPILRRSGPTCSTTSRSPKYSDAQSISANACFIARAVAATAASAGRVRSVALNGSARTGPS